MAPYKRNFLLLVFILILSAYWPATAQAISLKDVAGSWAFSADLTVEYLKSSNSPELEAFNKNLSPNAFYNLRIDEKNKTVALNYYERKQRSFLLTIISQSGSDNTLTLRLGESSNQEEVLSLKLVLLDKNTLAMFLGQATLVLVKQQSRQAAEGKDITPLLGKWELVLKNSPVRNMQIVKAPTEHADGEIELTLNISVGGKPTDVTRHIPFTVTEISKTKATVHIFSAPAFREDNGGGGSTTWPIEEGDIAVEFLDAKSMLVKIPIFAETLRFKRT